MRNELAKFFAGPKLASRSAPILDPPDDVVADSTPEKGRKLSDPGGARHVDFRQFATNEIEADEMEAIGGQSGTDIGDELALVGIELRRLDRAAHVDVRPELAFRRNAQDGAERSSTEEEDPLVAAAHLGKVLLHHRELGPLVRQQIDDRPGVRVAPRHGEHPEPTGAGERLDDGPSADCIDERVKLVAVRRDEGARRPSRKLERVELLVCVAQPSRVVDDEGLASDPFKQLGRVSVRGVEGRILSDEHRVERGDVDAPTQPVGTQPPPLDRKRLHGRGHRRGVTGTPLELMNEAVMALVPERERSLDEPEGRVLLGDDSLDGVHDEQETHDESHTRLGGREQHGTRRRRRPRPQVVERGMAAANSKPPRPRRTFRSLLQANRSARRAAKLARQASKVALRAQRAKERRDLWQDAKNLPNLLTFLRILMIPAVLVFLEQGSPRACFWAAVIYSAAAVTDMLDGWLARRQGLVSILGKFLDPLADKLIVAAVLVWLVSMGRMPAWAVVVLLSREITITALRGIASSEGLVIAAGDGGKLKTALQMIGLICLIVGYPYEFWFVVDFGRVDFVHVGRLLVYLSIVFSITSAASYLQLFAQAIDRKNQPLVGRAG